MIAASSSFARVLQAGYASRAAAMQVSQGPCYPESWNLLKRLNIKKPLLNTAALPADHHVWWSVTGCNHTSSTEWLDLASTTIYSHYFVIFFWKKKKPNQNTHPSWKVNVHSNKLRNGVMDAKRIVFSTEHVASRLTSQLPIPPIKFNTKLLILTCSPTAVVSRPAFNRQQSTWKDAYHPSTFYSWKTRHRN